MNKRIPSSRTIAYLSDSTQPGMAVKRCLGAAAAAKAGNLNIVAIDGRNYRYTLHPWQRHHDVLYNFLTPESFDGVVLGSVLREDVLSEDVVRAFYAHIPPHAVSLRQSLPGIPYTEIDDYQGMREALDHLIDDHCYRRIAFLRGPEGHVYAQDRYRAYVDALHAHGLPFDDRLVTPPSDWRTPGIEVLLDERGLRPGMDFEAVVAVSDVSKAIEASQILQRRGVRVPEDVAVVGFDCLEDGFVQTPPLTTVRMPFYEQGGQAVEQLVALMDGAQSDASSIRAAEQPQAVSLAARLVIRQSCGCLGPTVMNAAAGSFTSCAPDTFEDALRAQQRAILADMLEPLDASENMRQWASRAFEAFLADMRGTAAGSFVATWQRQIYQAEVCADGYARWQDALSAFRRRILPYLSSVEQAARAEDLWGQARVLLEQMLQWRRDVQQLREDQLNAGLRSLEADMMTTFDIAELMDILAEGLPQIGIPACYVALYESHDTSQPEWARLRLAYTERGRIALPQEGLRFPTRRFVPPDMRPTGRWFHLLVKPLYFKDETLGFIAFDVGMREERQCEMYDALRAQISSALQGAQLVERVRERSAEITRQKYILDTFMENVPDSIYFKDRECRFVQANKALADRFRVDDPARLAGKSDFDFFPEELARPKYEEEQTILRTGKPLLNVEEPDAGGYWSLTTKMPLRDEHGDIIGTFGISRDITPLKQAQFEVAAAYEEIRILNDQLQEDNLRMSAELDVARRIQEMVLPSPAELKDIKGLDIVGFMQPADEVGGDYYDVLYDHGVLHIGIGDVTGHGLESGVLMLMTQTTIRALIEHGETDPVAFINTLNRTIYKNVQRMKAEKTLTFALLTYQNGQLKLVGQHEELLLVRQGGMVERIDTVDLGFPIGLEPNIADWVATASVTLRPEESVVLYTDGITEAENRDGQMYGLDRLCDALSRHWDQSAEGMKDAVIADVLGHIGTQQVYDDLTLVILKQQASS